MIDRHGMVYRCIGAKIAYYRTIRGLSQEKLAQRVSLSTSTLSKIERGKYNSGLSIATMLDIADRLGVGLEMLVVFDELEKQLLRKQGVAE